MAELVEPAIIFLSYDGGNTEAIVGDSLKIRRYILHRWQNVDNDRENGTWAIRGAREGAAWSYLHRADGQELRKMNQFDWLRARFEENLSSIDKGLPEYFTLPEKHWIG